MSDKHLELIAVLEKGYPVSATDVADAAAALSSQAEALEAVERRAEQQEGFKFNANRRAEAAEASLREATEKLERVREWAEKSQQRVGGTGLRQVCGNEVTALISLTEALEARDEGVRKICEAARNVVEVRYGIAPLPTDGDHGLDEAIIHLQCALFIAGVTDEMFPTSKEETDARNESDQATP